jgi:hypothetical protein
MEMEIKSKYRINLNNMLDYFYCEVTEPGGSFTEKWNYNTYELLETISTKEGKEIRKIENTGNSAESNYFQLLSSCIILFQNEIDQNVYSMFEKERIEYLKEIHESYNDRIQSINEIISILTAAKLENKRITVLRDRDKIHPIQVRFLTKFLDEFKRKYEKYLHDEVILAPQEKIELANKKMFDQNVILCELISHKNTVEIVKEIKIKYKNIKGKRLKLLLVAFQDLDLIQKDRFGKKFHECCKKEFDWNIGSYSAMNDYKINERIDNDELNKMKAFLCSLTMPI